MRSLSFMILVSTIPFLYAYHLRGARQSIDCDKCNDECEHFFHDRFCKRCREHC